jgi:hypothetical protein
MIFRSVDSGARSARKSVRAKSVTHVLGTLCPRSPGRTPQGGLVDVRRFELPTPCFQSRSGKTLNAFAGVAYTENRRNSRPSVVPKLYRISLTCPLLAEPNEQSQPRRRAQELAEAVPWKMSGRKRLLNSSRMRIRSMSRVSFQRTFRTAWYLQRHRDHTVAARPKKLSRPGLLNS